MKSAKSEFRWLDRGFKETLVLIPGWATDYRIFYDLDWGYNYFFAVRCSPLNFVRQLKEALDKLSLNKVSILGWSQGAFLSADFAQGYPEYINKCFLLSIRKRFDSDRLKEIERKLKKNKRAYLYKFYETGFSPKKEDFAQFKKYLLKDYLNGMELKDLIEGLNYLSQAEIKTQSLAKIERITIIHGREDKVAPFEEAKDIAKGLPQAEFVPLDKTGHLWINRL